MPSFNPIIVRFKLTTIWKSTRYRSNFQSYNSSIQTICLKAESKHLPIFQSYNSSIQTNELITDSARMVVFQSYNSSIQTQTNFLAARLRLVSFNPIIVRFKLIHILAMFSIKSSFNPIIVRFKQCFPFQGLVTLVIFQSYNSSIQTIAPSFVIVDPAHLSIL